MSPKSNKSGISYDERDPRSVLAQQESSAAGPRVVRARDFDAAVEGLQAERPAADPDDFVGEDAEGADEQQLGGSDATGDADSYDDKEAWPYASLQGESRNRWPDMPVSGVSREDLVARLREDDANTSLND